MSIILDRLIVRTHYGAAKVREINQLVPPALNRLIAAQRMAEGAGLLEHSYSSLHAMRSDIKTIKVIEKHLKFLEDNGAIRVDDTGTVFYSNSPVDLGPIGKGVIDMDFTALGIILDARHSMEDFCPVARHQKNFSASLADLFKESSDLSSDGTYYFLFRKLLMRNLRHPILSFVTARELAASHALFDANIVAARGARRDWIKRFPEKQDRIRLIEEKMQEAKSVPQHLVNQMLFEDNRPKAESGLTIVVSDLHIGSRGFEDEKEFLRLCLMAKTLGAKMIINGDTFDMAEYGFNLKSAIKNNQTLLRAIHQNYGRLVKGNHDDKLAAFSLELPNHQIVEFDPVDKIEQDGVYIEHGHQSGKMFEHSWWKPLYLPISFMEKHFGHKFLKWAELLQRSLYNIAGFFVNLFRLPGDKIDLWEKTKVKSIVNRARTLYREHGGKNLIIIIGHEHFAGVAATLKKVIDAIRNDPEIGGGKVKFYCSGGCKGREGYAADFVVIDHSDKDNPVVYPFVWEYTHNKVIVFKEAA